MFEGYKNQRGEAGLNGRIEWKKKRKEMPVIQSKGKEIILTSLGGGQEGLA